MAKITNMTISEMQQKMAAGELSARALTEAYLQRIAEIDHSGPNLRSVIEVNPDALEIAEAMDDERQASGPRGPMHGISVLLKDNIDTADKMLTTAGSFALAGEPALRDARVASKLREAGAVILGKTNLSEWANFRSTHSVSGWSSRGGQTRNPYALDRNPCGSSSGSGVAVAADLCAAAVGTETDGSIVCPSHINGIVGLKPTLGLVSRAGIVPIAHSQDTAGPMGRTVSDVALLLGALAGADPNDPTTEIATQAPSDYTQFLDKDGLKGARLGIARNYFGYNPRVDKVMEDAIEAMRQAGAEIIDPAPLELPKEVGDGEMEVLLYEFKTNLNNYLAGRGDGCPVRTLAEVIAYNAAHPDKMMPYFGQELLIMAEAKGPLTEETYLQALQNNRRMAGEEGIDALLREHSLDAIVAPTGGPAWLIDYVSGDHHGGGSSSAAAVAGYPAITVPAGYVWGLPVGISFFAGAFSEATLLRVAYAFEQVTHARRTPTFPTSASTIP
ncbi:MAG TPA: amidase [Chloroflexia bacterium]|nr:amidase [Chloroflexia bacterium]